MPIETRKWGPVEIGDIVRDKKDHLWWVREYRIIENDLLLDNGREQVRMNRPPADWPVDVYVPTEAEAVNLAIEALGGRMLKQIEEREHDLARRHTWRLEPVARRPAVIRDHLDMIHQVPVDDVLRRWQGTAVNPASKQTRKQALDELVEAHQYVHDHPEDFPSPLPHVHNLDPKESP
jgi:hypothetical protein